MSVDPFQLAPLLTVALMYGLRARTLAREGRPVPRARQWSWYGGLVLIAATLSSPIAALAEDLFVAHMAEHLLIAEVGGLLLVLGLTGPVLVPVLRIRELQWMQALSHPVAAWALWAVNLTFWHLPGPHEAAVQTDWIHAIQHMAFIGFAANAWMALLGPLPKPAWFGTWAQLGYLLALRLYGTLIANVFVWAGAPLYDVYAPGEAARGISPISDQVAAGSVMMVEGSIVTVLLLGWLFVRAGQREEATLALDAFAAERGVVLEPGRAARAVAAGRADDLRARIEGHARDGVR